MHKTSPFRMWCYSYGGFLAAGLLSSVAGKWARGQKSDPGMM